MMQNNGNKQTDFRDRCLCGEMYARTVRDKVTKEEKEVVLTIWQLRKMKITEIIVKIVSYSWAVIWSMTSILCLFTEEYKLMMPVAALPAVGFWVILSRSSGSVREIDMEIRKLKKTS